MRDVQPERHTRAVAMQRSKASERPEGIAEGFPEELRLIEHPGRDRMDGRGGQGSLQQVELLCRGTRVHADTQVSVCARTR